MVEVVRYVHDVIFGVINKAGWMLPLRCSELPILQTFFVRTTRDCLGFLGPEQWDHTDGVIIRIANVQSALCGFEFNGLWVAKSIEKYLFF